MTVVALDEYWTISRDRIDERFSWKLLLGPFSFIPSPAQHPFAPKRFLCLGCDAFCELLRGCCICQLNLFELCAALNEMHVRVVKSWQQQFASSVDHFGGKLLLPRSEEHTSELQLREN